jgi:hypothetical protein
LPGYYAIAVRGRCSQKKDTVLSVYKYMQSGFRAETREKNTEIVSFSLRRLMSANRQRTTLLFLLNNFLPSGDTDMYNVYIIYFSIRFP